MKLAASASGPTYAASGVEYATLIGNPSKVVCVGLNYKDHIEEMGRDLPEYPTLFTKFADTLVGATDDIVRPEHTMVDGLIEIQRQMRGRRSERRAAGP